MLRDKSERARFSIRLLPVRRAPRPHQRRGEGWNLGILEPIVTQGAPRSPRRRRRAAPPGRAPSRDRPPAAQQAARRSAARAAWPRLPRPRAAGRRGRPRRRHGLESRSRGSLEVPWARRRVGGRAASEGVPLRGLGVPNRPLLFSRARRARPGVGHVRSCHPVVPRRCRPPGDPSRGLACGAPVEMVNLGTGEFLGMWDRLAYNPRSPSLRPRSPPAHP